MSFFYSNSNDYAYYGSLLRAHSSGISDVAMKASSIYIESSQLRFSFLKEIDDLCISKYKIVQDKNRSHEEKISAIHELKKEEESLRWEFLSLAKNTISKYLYVEIEKREKIVNATIKGASLIGGIGQVMMGVPLVAYPPSYSVGGATVGFLAISHGVNNIYESVEYFINNDMNASGYTRDFYRGITNILGGNDHIADNVYISIDLALSFRGAFGKVPIPNKNSMNSTVKVGPFIIKNYDSTHTGRLFRYMDSDFKFGISQMTKGMMIVEFINDTYNLNLLLSK
ncbi:TPA: DUF4225 domain-containing protein [Proteus mirabilis]|nr:DUF4225 domain-containing protein [Proteus mirabilis]